MAIPHCFEQSIYIAAPVDVVDQTITDRTLMHQWLNPALKCESIGPWSSELGSQFQFLIQIPILAPSLKITVIEREPGLVVWAFDGYFQGSDRWQCTPKQTGTRLLNRFEFAIANPIVSFGFWTFAAPWTRKDMQAQLKRLKRTAETLFQTNSC